MKTLTGDVCAYLSLIDYQFSAPSIESPEFKTELRKFLDRRRVDKERFELFLKAPADAGGPQRGTKKEFIFGSLISEGFVVVDPIRSGPSESNEDFRCELG